MTTLRDNGMLILRYMYENGGGFAHKLMNEDIRRGCTQLDDSEFFAAKQFLMWAGFIKYPAPDEYHMTAAGVDAAQRDLEEGTFLRRKRDDLLLLLVGAILGIAATLLGGLLLK